MLRIILALAALWLAPACAHAAPPWVEDGSHSEPEGSGKVVYGVGAVRGPHDSPQTRAAAANRARHEIVRQLQPKRRFNAATLSGIEIAAYFVEPNGTVFALAVYRPK